MTTNQDTRVIKELEKFGLKWTLEPNYDIRTLSVDRRVQVREQKHYASKVNVAQFAQHPLPSIVVSADAYIIDGNTRIGAFSELDRFLVPAIVVDVNYKTATPKEQSNIRALAATFNQFGGVRLTPKEIRVITAELIGSGWDAKRIGEAVGSSTSIVNRVRREINANKRIKDVGVDVSGSRLQGVSMHALGSPSAIGLNIQPYKKLCELAIDAGLKSKEINDAVREIKAAGADVDALKKLENLRIENAQRIQDKAVTGNGFPPPSRSFRQLLTPLLKKQDNETDLIERNPDLVEDYVSAMQEMAIFLNRLVEQQKEAA
jgi:uncharacterized protein (UPF0335 family)